MSPFAIAEQLGEKGANKRMGQKKISSKPTRSRFVDELGSKD